MHRDIKPSNIMISQNFNFKLIDYGSLKKVTKGEKLSECAGTPYYMSKEMVRGKYGIASD